MCGILGVDRTWRDDPDGFGRALAALAWRGPDGCVAEDAGRWKLGVARLAISDPAAPQPIRCAATGRVALFNGADTHQREDWRRWGPGRTHNDAELLLLRLAASGPGALPPRAGHGAGAVVDPRSDELWLFQDPCGEKPLFVLAVAGRIVAFASTLAALHQLGAAPALERDALGQWLRFGFHGGGWRTAAEVDGGELHGDLAAWAGMAFPVWHQRGDAAAVAHPAAHGADPVAAAPPAGLRATLGDAALRCADAEVPVALSLSGGVDSACVAAALAERDRKVACYQFRASFRAGGETVATDGAERARAQSVARHLDWELQLVDGGSELADVLPALTRACGQPLGDPSVLAAHAVARAAAADGCKVMLSGEGADEYWFGYRRHRLGQHLRRRWMPRWVPGLGERSRWGRWGMTEGARVRRALGDVDPYAALLSVSPPGFIERVFAGTGLGGTGLVGAALPGPPVATAGGRAAALRRIGEVDRRGYLRWDLLPKLDLATLYAGVEGRCPFLDPDVRRLAQRAAERPLQVVGKKPLAAAFAPLLPEGFFRQRKRGFGVPLDDWLREDQNLLLDTLRDRETRERPHLRRDELAAALDRHRGGRISVGHALYLVVALELWLRDGGRLCG